MNVELHSENPREKLWPRIARTAKDATFIDLAVAFVTADGSDAIRRIAAELPSTSRLRLLVSVMFPTDLGEIAKLPKTIGVGIHLADPNKEFDEDHKQFHSKIVYIERPDHSCTVVVGSHNWTGYGLHGGNLEASFVIDCTKDESVPRQVREHIDRCWKSSRTELFNEDRIEDYKALQRKLHFNLSDKKMSKPFPGFEPLSDETIVILAEGESHLPENSKLHFAVDEGLNEKFVPRRPAILFLFPRRTLFDNQSPLPKPIRYSGEIAGAVADMEFASTSDKCFIRDIQRPVIDQTEEKLHRRAGEMEVGISFRAPQASEAVPVFHTEGAPRVAQVLDQDTDYSRDELPDESRHTPPPANRADRIAMRTITGSVPTGLIAKADLCVPFQFLYPETLQSTLEAFGDSQSFFSQSTPCRVHLKRIRSKIGKFMFFVKYRSNADLTKLIYSNSENP